MILSMMPARESASSSANDASTMAHRYQPTRVMDVCARREEHGGAGLAPQPEKLVTHQESRLLIERAEGLVEKDQPRLHYERAGDANALAHAAREVRRMTGGEIRKANELQGLAYPVVDFGSTYARAAQAERDVLRHVEPGERGVLLEHDADAIGRLTRDSAAFELDLAIGHRGQTGDHFEERRLAAARRADHREELTALDLEIDRTERVQRSRRVPRREGLADAGEPDLRSGHARLSPRRRPGPNFPPQRSPWIPAFAGMTRPFPIAARLRLLLSDIRVI